MICSFQPVPFMMFSTWCPYDESMVPMLTETTEVSEQQHFFGFFIRLLVQVDEIHGTSG
jgi:hypothetical protein